MDIDAQVPVSATPSTSTRLETLGFASVYQSSNNTEVMKFQNVLENPEKLQDL